jgi:hypothetical protein
MAIAKGDDPTKPDRKKRREIKNCDMFGSCTPPKGRARGRGRGSSTIKGDDDVQSRDKIRYETYTQKVKTPEPESGIKETKRVVKGEASTTLVAEKDKQMVKSPQYRESARMDQKRSERKNTEEDVAVAEKKDPRFEGRSQSYKDWVKKNEDRKKTPKESEQRREVRKFRNGELEEEKVVSKGTKKVKGKTPEGGTPGEIRVTKHKSEGGRELKRPVTRVTDLDKYNKELKKIQSRRVFKVSPDKARAKAKRRATRKER